MTKPKQPDPGKDDAGKQDFGKLSLDPSRHATGGKADFSNVRSNADTVADRSGGGGGGRPDFSNVTSSASTVPGYATPTASAQAYTVKSGDTLSGIAQKQLGKASRWREIFDANRDQIDNPDLIHPGQVLKLPAQDTADNG